MRTLLSIFLSSSMAFGYSDPMFPNVHDTAYHSYSQDEALNITENAILQREDVKLLAKNSEVWGWKQMHYVGITERMVSPVVIFTTTFIQQKISTKGVIMHWEPVKSLTLRPDVDYNFNGSDYSVIFNIGYGF